MERRLYEELKEYSGRDVRPFHMPGHKRRIKLMDELYSVDITEIDGFDDLHEAEGILREGMDRMAEAVGAKRSWYLVGGSTCGILSAVHAAAKPQGTILVDRNCHRSAANSILLRRLYPIYIYPQYVDKWGISRGLSVDKVEEACEQAGENPVLILTSPTYEGHVCAVKEIAEVIHRRGGLLIVDEAHGAHLPYARGTDFPESAVNLGADLVIQSLHKTLPALTQSAALHLCSDRVGEEEIEDALRIYETSSPSYVMMAGMDECVRFMQEKGGSLLSDLHGRLTAFYGSAGQWKNLEVYGETRDRDISRILIRAKDYPGSGRALAGLLREAGIEPEYCSPDFVLLIATLADTEEAFGKLTKALTEADRRIESGLRNAGSSDVRLPEAKVRMAPWLADEADKERTALSGAVGRISGEMVYLYPPGVPFIMPGEEIVQEHADLIRKYREGGFSLSGLRDRTGESLLCLKES